MSHTLPVVGKVFPGFYSYPPCCSLSSLHPSLALSIDGVQPTTIFGITTHQGLRAGRSFCPSNTAQPSRAIPGARATRTRKPRMESKTLASREQKKKKKAPDKQITWHNDRWRQRTKLRQGQDGSSTRARLRNWRNCGIAG